MKDLTNQIQTELDQLCTTVRNLVSERNYAVCFELICQAMENHPHSPQPHNLMGIILEKTGDHLSAMKHFRAAWALDPAYLPASHNLNTYGTFFSKGICAFDESDVQNAEQEEKNYIQDERGIGHIVRKLNVKHDEHGIVRVTRR